MESTTFAAFAKPVAGDKLRKYRVGGIAMVDVVGTAVGAVIAARLARGHFDVMSTIIAFIILMVIAIIAHVAIGQPTKLNHMLGLSKSRGIVDYS